jgi:hypothetical protein
MTMRLLSVMMEALITPCFGALTSLDAGLRTLLSRLERQLGDTTKERYDKETSHISLCAFVLYLLFQIPDSAISDFSPSTNPDTILTPS